MIGAVVLDDEPGLPVVQIGPADKPRIGIAELDLNFGARWAGLQKQPPKSGLHGRFGCFGEHAQRRADATESSAERLIEDDQRLDRRKPMTHVA